MAELGQKYEVILSYEEHFAYRLGREVIEKPAASVWMILLPILFVHHAQRISRYKAGVRSFARGILDSKQKALDMAVEDVESGSEEPCRQEDLFPEITSSAPEKDRMLVEKQVRVIRLQQRHYRRMLKAGGESYAQLLRSAYPHATQYRRFLESLSAAEQELNRYLIENVHTDEASRVVVKKIERCCSEFREKEVRSFF